MGYIQKKYIIKFDTYCGHACFCISFANICSYIYNYNVDTLTQCFTTLFLDAHQGCVRNRPLYP